MSDRYFSTFELSWPQCQRCLRRSPLLTSLGWCAVCLGDTDVTALAVLNLAYDDDILSRMEEEVSDEREYEYRERLKPNRWLRTDDGG